MSTEIDQQTYKLDFETDGARTEPGDEILIVTMPDPAATPPDNYRYSLAPQPKQDFETVLASKLNKKKRPENLPEAQGDIHDGLPTKDEDETFYRFRTVAGLILWAALKEGFCDQESFAYAAQRSPAMISRILRGRQDPSLGTLLRILDSTGFEVTFTVARKLDHPATQLIKDLMITLENNDNVGGWNSRVFGKPKGDG